MSACTRRGQTEWMFVAITIDEVHSDKSEAIPFGKPLGAQQLEPAAHFEIPPGSNWQITVGQPNAN